MKRLVSALGSVRLFLGLVTAIVVFAGIATFIPQGLEPAAYQSRYGTVAGGVMTAIGIDDFFDSRLLFGLLIAVELNLILCTMPRLLRRVTSIVRRLRSRDPRSRYAGERGASLAVLFGPDIIHLGLILAIAGGLVVSATRVELQYLVPVGAEVRFDDALPPIIVVDSREIRDNDGTVVDWQIDLAYDGEVRTVAINDPIGIAGRRIHFFHWGNEPVMVLHDPVGIEYNVHIGEGLRSPDGKAHVLAGFASGDLAGGPEPRPVSARIHLLGVDRELEGERLLAPGDRLGQYVYAGVDTEVMNGFTVTSGRGRMVVIVGFVVLLAGFGIYSFGTWRKYG